ncbi:MAG TPA: hypothetical protein VFS33_00470 [Gemmatimonadales bacterium]|nr:hypothetical protein [Gemmatimonadales bacterium]
MIARALAIWLLLLVLAIANGGFREAVLIPRLGPDAAHRVSTLLLCALILLAVSLTIGWLRPTTLRSALTVGGLWVVLTLAFEFLAGHYLFGRPWEVLLADYDVRAGRIWVLVLIVTLLAPAWAGRMRHLFGGPPA